MIVQARGAVRPFDGATDVAVKFRPGRNAITWLTLGCFLTMLSVAALVITLVDGKARCLPPPAGYCSSAASRRLG